MLCARVVAALLAVVTLAALGPASAADSQERPAPVPILMYHVLAEPPATAPFPHLYVSPAEFRAQLEWLDLQGYTAITLGALWRSWHTPYVLPAKPIVVSIDDGFRDTFTVALPALQAHGWPGVLNLAVSHLDVGWGLTEGRMRALLRAGWELGSHTLTHPDLTGLDDARLEHEIGGSKRLLERRFGVHVEFFCYPGGRFDARVVAAVRRAGYLGATTTIHGLGRSAEPFTLRRIRIAGGDGVRGLAMKLARTK